MSFLDKLFSPNYTKELKAVQPMVAQINTLEPSIQMLDNQSLAKRISAIRAEVSGGASLDDFLPEVFALVRESAKRTLGLRHYDVQMMGGVILHHGKITEMRTGEGKTLVATLPATLNALTGRGVHVVTVNDYLARRDAVWMGQVYSLLGLSVAVINGDNASYLYDPTHQEKDEVRDGQGSYKVIYDFLRPCTRQEAYTADVTYGTNSEFGFDYLRDNIEYEPDRVRQRQHSYAIIDEIDSILIDEARTPLIISAPAADTENLYPKFAEIVSSLRPNEHYTVDEKMRSVAITDSGIETAERLLGIDNIYTEKGIRYVHHLETAVRARALFTRDKEYVVRDGEVIIVDEFTGRLQPGRRWSDGLHQAVEAKEGVQIQKESRTFASITYQNFFRLYDKLSGMTGTALTSQEEFYTVYNLEVVPVTPNRTIQRKDQNDLIFQNEKGKFQAIIEKVKKVHATKQPILIGTASIETNERLSVALAKAGVEHEVLNAKNHEREGEIIAAAGRLGAVTLATNMAGRGVDIKLGGPEATAEEADEVRKLGGLFVLGTERHEARRIDNQLRGRSGRQGDPGETQFYVSMDDSLMRVFGGDKVQRLMGTFKIPEDQPLEMGLISQTLEGAQSRIEGFHFDSRKQVLAYDDVLNAQRKSVYDRRRRLLMNDPAESARIRQELASTHGEVEDVLKQKHAEFGDLIMEDLFRRLALQLTDQLWVEHLEVMSYTRSSVTLRSYGQRDPLVEYRKEGNRLFKEMQAALLDRLAIIIPKIQPQLVAREEAERKHEAEVAQDAAGRSGDSAQNRKFVPPPGRNDIVKITNGDEIKELKFKKAEPLLKDGVWRIL